MRGAEFQRSARSALGGIGLELDPLVKDLITFIILGKEEAPALPRQRQPRGGEIPVRAPKNKDFKPQNLAWAHFGVDLLQGARL